MLMRYAVGICAAVMLSASPLAAGAQDQQPDHETHVVDAGPTFHIQGFMDINYMQIRHPQATDGFSLGQFAAHLTSRLGNKVTFFGETSVTAQQTGFTVEVERAILRYDYNDHFKISAGRYHTPINYWNTAFHHGLWLQTTVSRPDMIKGGGTFQPVHFLGLLVEGNISSPSLGLAYNVGLGNGRSTIISRAGDAGDVNRNRAWLAKIYSRPAGTPGLEFGGAIYHDVVPVAGTQGYPERIASAYVALAREASEVIAEFANVRHHDRVSQREFNSRAGYVQVASRLVDWPRWKPYARYEKLVADPSEPVFGDLHTSILSAGVRFELSDQAALKAEYHRSRRVEDPRPVHGLWLQAAFTF
jgi:hypothetical protein